MIESKYLEGNPCDPFSINRRSTTQYTIH